MNHLRRALLSRLLPAALLAAWLPAPGLAAGAPDRGAITVFAAASLSNVLQELGDGFSRQSPAVVRFSFAASSTLARQIENGAAADIFVSADLEWMDYLQARNLVEGATRREVAGNRLVLVAPAGSAVRLAIGPHFPLLAALGGGRLAIADPDSVPAGRYARQALMFFGVWNSVASHLARADSVRAALLFVDRGETPLGIVYATDARIDPKVAVIGVFPEASHRPITYPMALTSTKNPGAAAFMAYVRGPAGAAAFGKFGFIAPP